MANKINSYVDLREVPNEIIIGAYSAVSAGYWAGVDELFDNNQSALDEFKLIINPYNSKIIHNRKKEVVDSTAREIYDLAEKNPVISDEYVKQHADTIKTAKYKIAELDKIHRTHNDFYLQIEDIMKRASWLKEKTPLCVHGPIQTVIINDGNAVYVEHRDVNNNFNVLYCEANHKELVDNLINEVYASFENLGVSQSEPPEENE